MPGDTPIGDSSRFFVLTPAHDEGHHLDALAQSIVNQEIRPDAWVIVNDGSADDTAEIAERYAEKFPFIHLVNRERIGGRKLSSKAHAVASGYEAAIRLVPDAAFVASLDGDVELPPHAFEYLLEQFSDDPDLGVTGGIYLHPVKGQRRPGRISPTHVPGPFQFFRREVFDAIGGFKPMDDGGLDTVANASARMLGWKTHAFPELQFHHNRRMGTGDDRSPVKADYHGGQLDYVLGSSPIYEIVKCTARLFDNPLLLGSLARLAGFASYAIRRETGDVPKEVAAFIRREQLDRLRQMIMVSRRRSPARLPGL